MINRSKLIITALILALLLPALASAATLVSSSVSGMMSFTSPSQVVISATGVGQTARITNISASAITLNGSAIGDMVLLSTTVLAGLSSVTYDSSYITSAYRTYRLISGDFSGSSSCSPLITFSTNNGASFIGGGYGWGNFRGGWNASAGTGQAVGAGVISDSAIHIQDNGIGCSAGPYSFDANLYNLLSTVNKKQVTYTGFYQEGQFLLAQLGGGWITSTTPVNAIKVAPNGGTLSGTMQLYGIK